MQIMIQDRTAFCDAPAELTATGIPQMVADVKASLNGWENFDLVCVNLSATEHIDSMGLTFLIGLYKTCALQNKPVKLTGYSDSLFDIFKIMKFDELFELSK